MMNILQKIFGPVEKDLEAKLEAAANAGLAEGKRLAYNEIAALFVSRVGTLEPEKLLICSKFLQDLGVADQ